MEKVLVELDDVGVKYWTSLVNTVPVSYTSGTRTYGGKGRVGIMAIKADLNK